MRHKAQRNPKFLTAQAVVLLASMLVLGSGCQLTRLPPVRVSQAVQEHAVDEHRSGVSSASPAEVPGSVPTLSSTATIRGQSGDDWNASVVDRSRQPMVPTNIVPSQPRSSAQVVTYPTNTAFQPPSVDTYGYTQGPAQNYPAQNYPAQNYAAQPGVFPPNGYGPNAVPLNTLPSNLPANANPAYPSVAPGGFSPSDYGSGVYGTPATPGFNPMGSNEAILAPGVYPGNQGFDPAGGGLNPGILGTPPGYQPRERITPLDIVLQERRSGRVLFGGTVNSDLGVAGQVIIEERNFDIRAFPRSWNDPQAFYGDGQDFRVELMPGDRVQRYTVSWSNRNLFGYLPYNISVGGFYYTRQLRDWTEQRAGGRVALGYSNSRYLSLSSEIRLEDVKIFEPRIAGVAELDDALGSNDIYTARFRIARDSRDSPFLTTEGSLLELVYDQVFGEYDYPRGQINFSRYFRVNERQTITSTWKVGITGSQTPVFENYFAGGYSTLRGFGFRGASPKDGDVQVGGELSLLGSLEYVFPLTADEMLRAVAFVDYGTVERDLKIDTGDIRVAPGLGLRLSIPALGPAPLAFDFAYPVNKADTDERKLFSFFMGLTR